LKKPILLYFYWPEDKASKSRAQYRDCQKMNKLLFEDPDVKDELSKLDCYKVNLSILSKELKKQYKIKSAPTLIFIDPTGKVLKKSSSTRTKPSRMVRLIKSVVKASARNLKRYKKKLAQEEKKEKPQAKEEDEAKAK